jgi:hypothetical protein
MKQYKVNKTLLSSGAGASLWKGYVTGPIETSQQLFLCLQARLKEGYLCNY